MRDELVKNNLLPDIGPVTLSLLVMYSVQFWLTVTLIYNFIIFVPQFFFIPSSTILLCPLLLHYNHAVNHHHFSIVFPPPKHFYCFPPALR